MVRWRTAIWAGLSLVAAAVSVPALGQVMEGRPQTPVPPFDYPVEQVRFASADRAAGTSVELAGTLTLPRGTGPHPALVLISGSGAQDRDQNIMAHRPFFVLADHLAREGVAVLRYDDRGVGGSGGSLETATLDDLADDVRGALAFLAEDDRIDPSRIGLLGHSEGGQVAFLAANDALVSHVIAVATPLVGMKTTVLDQIERISVASGLTRDQVNERLLLQGQVYDALAQDGPETEEKAVAVLRSAGMPEQVARGQVKMLIGPAMADRLAFDPAAALEQVAVPVQFIFAGRDAQVAPVLSQPIADQFVAGAADCVSGQSRVVVLPGLNHLMQPAQTGLPSEYGTIRVTLDDSYLFSIGVRMEEMATARPCR